MFLHPTLVALTIVFARKEDLGRISRTHPDLEQHEFYNADAVFPEDLSNLLPPSAERWWEKLGKQPSLRFTYFPTYTFSTNSRRNSKKARFRNHVNPSSSPDLSFSPSFGSSVSSSFSSSVSPSFGSSVSSSFGLSFSSPPSSSPSPFSFSLGSSAGSSAGSSFSLSFSSPPSSFPGSSHTREKSHTPSSSPARPNRGAGGRKCADGRR